MKILNRYPVPTGDIIVVEADKGKLEFLSIGDYGQSNNIKADFLGYTKPINGVSHGELLPLTEKWVITISSQYGCSMGCKFCDVPKVGKGINATEDDMINQVKTAMNLHPEIDHGRINLHYARMGEPSFNMDVVGSAYKLQEMLVPKFDFHPVVSTMMPNKNVYLQAFIDAWMGYKELTKDAGLQLSINSTDEVKRMWMFNNQALCLSDIGRIVNQSIDYHGVEGRKVTLNFILSGWKHNKKCFEIDPEKLLKYFDPQYYMCKITPMHDTSSSKTNELMIEGYDLYDTYKDIEESLVNAGYDTLVFVPSIEEDISKITCGNAILAGANDEE